MLKMYRYSIPRKEVPSVEERLAELKSYGFPIRHLFGSWYIGRQHGYETKFSLWIIFQLKEKK